MMVVYPGDLRVFHLTRRSEVFVPASEGEAARFYAAYDRELPRRIRPMIDVLDEAFPPRGSSLPAGRSSGAGCPHRHRARARRL